MNIGVTILSDNKKKDLKFLTILWYTKMFLKI